MNLPVPLGGFMKQVVITWGFNQYNGEPYLDCYLEITDCDKDGTAVKMMDLRGRSQGTTLALIRVPTECQREDIANYIKMNTSDVIELLKKAKVHVNEITRKRMSENNAIDFIMS